MKTIIHSLLILGLLSVGSCTVEKRLYNKGYRISWNKKFHSANVEKEVAQSEDLNDQLAEEMMPEKTPVDQVTTSESPIEKQQVEIQKQDAREKIVISQKSKNHLINLEKISSGQEAKTIQKPKEQHAQKVLKKERSSHGKAVLFLINGLLFALLGWVFITWFGIAGVIFGAMFLVVALILLILSLVYFI